MMTRFIETKDLRFVLDYDRDLENFCIIIDSTMQYWRDERNNFRVTEGLFGANILG